MTQLDEQGAEGHEKKLLIEMFTQKKTQTKNTRSYFCIWGGGRFTFGEFVQNIMILCL